jgi:MFS family permease
VIVPVAPAIADATDAGPATIGLLVASFPTGMVVGFALAGSVVRRRGARALLVASLAFRPRSRVLPAIRRVLPASHGLA